MSVAAVMALVLACASVLLVVLPFGFFVAVVTCPIAFVLSIVGVVKTAGKRRMRGLGMAIAGAILSALVGLFILLLGGGILLAWLLLESAPAGNGTLAIMMASP